MVNLLSCDESCRSIRSIVSGNKVSFISVSRVTLVGKCSPCTCACKLYWCLDSLDLSSGYGPILDVVKCFIFNLNLDMCPWQRHYITQLCLVYPYIWIPSVFIGCKLVVRHLFTHMVVSGWFPHKTCILQNSQIITEEQRKSQK